MLSRSERRLNICEIFSERCRGGEILFLKLMYVNTKEVEMIRHLNLQSTIKN